jgi:hypothetical protein
MTIGHGHWKWLQMATILVLLGAAGMLSEMLRGCRGDAIAAVQLPFLATPS